jgi:hypothetical protein
MNTAAETLKPKLWDDKKHGWMTIPNNILGMYCTPAQLQSMFQGSSA